MPLRKAVKENRYEVAKFLIENGMRPDPDKDTEFLYSALENQSIPMLQLLLPFFDLNRPGADASGHVEVRDAYLEDAEAMLVEDGWVIPLYYVHRHSGLAQQLTAPLYDGTGVYRFSAVVRQAAQ